MQIVLPAALSGVTAAIIVGISRAVGETMIVALAAGAGPNLTLNPFKSAETMTGHIVRIAGGDLSYDSIDYDSIFAIGLFLFFFTLLLNMISQRIVRRFREVRRMNRAVSIKPEFEQDMAAREQKGNGMACDISGLHGVWNCRPYRHAPEHH